jgi:hypothetical protein
MHEGYYLIMRNAAVFLALAFLALTSGAEPAYAKNILWLTTRPLAKHPLADLLGEAGYAVTLGNATDFRKSLQSGPDLVIAASDTKQFWRTVNEDDLGRWLSNHKLLAMGSVADELFDILELHIRTGAYGFSHEVEVELSGLMSAPRRIAAPDTCLVLWPPTNKRSYEMWIPGDSVWPAVQSLARPRGQERGASLVTRQGNFAHWGFDASYTRMTPQGRDFFLNVVAYLLAQPSTPLAQVRRRSRYVPAGQHESRIAYPERQDEWSFRLNQPGTISVSADAGTGSPLHICLVGPGSSVPVAESDRDGPAKLSFEVRPEMLALGSRWIVSVRSRYSNLPLADQPIPYRLELAFP